jgi:hypothetical protein
LHHAVDAARRLAAGRLDRIADRNRQYHPVGYVLSADKEQEDQVFERRTTAMRDRAARRMDDASKRLLVKPIPGFGLSEKNL